jgi:hypothetical protein
MTACTQTARSRALTRTGFWAFSLLLLVVAPLRPAHAYVDPNSVGPLYQFLFPLFIAIASALTALRRQIVRLWNRVIGTVTAVVRGQRPPPDTP